VSAGSAYSSGILEQAFMMKLAGEMQRRLEEERMKRGVSAGSGKIWREVERELRDLSGDPEAPPAYMQ
jgi:distribution and morphology protein 34